MSLFYHDVIGIVAAVFSYIDRMLP